MKVKWGEMAGGTRLVEISRRSESEEEERIWGEEGV